MREIKFRAWHRKYNKWKYYTLQDLIDGKADVDSEHLQDWCEYTGVKSENEGVEIYEGDIVTRTITLHPYEPYETIEEVRLFYGRFMPISEEVVTDSEVDYAYARYWKLIGNIYENPELKKEMK